MICEYDEDMVEKIKSIGGAKTIKTVRQGRSVSLTDGYIDEEPLNKGRNRRFNLRLTCSTIMKHPKSSEKQKEWAKDIFDKGTCSIRELSFIQNFMKRYKW